MPDRICHLGGDAVLPEAVEDQAANVDLCAPPRLVFVVVSVFGVKLGAFDRLACELERRRPGDRPAVREHLIEAVEDVARIDRLSLNELRQETGEPVWVIDGRVAENVRETFE